MKRKVAVGMSGGTDSSVVAALLVEQGWEVIGVTAHLLDSKSTNETDRAKKVCDALGIHHETIDLKEIFEQMIIDPFVESYVSGETPSPCINCNQFIKFDALLNFVEQLGCEKMATGHYAIIEKRDDSFHLMRAADPKKDQSYFLHRLSQQQLSKTLFPLGDWDKEQVKKWALDHELPAIPSGESQDLCFVEKGKHVEFIEQRASKTERSGAVFDSMGHMVAEHGGIHNFTIGQRGGMGLAFGERVYVSNINADKNSVTLSPREDVMKKECKIADATWVSYIAPNEGKQYVVQSRYGHKGAKATLSSLSDKKFQINFEEAQFALSPGQAAVVYDCNECLGGGWIY